MNPKSVSYSLMIVVVCLSSYVCASTVDNSVFTETPRINSGDEMVSSILNNCYDLDCLKGTVLSYLNTLVNERSDAGRSLNTADVDEAIYNRVGRILNTYEFRMPLPETFFHKSEITYRADRGIDVEVSKEAANEGDLLFFSLFFFCSSWADNEFSYTLF